MSNARFWTFHRLGWVKLTLRPGQSLHTFIRSFDEEGSSWESDRWTYEAGHVFRQWGSGGRDCDGTVSRTGEDACPLDQLHAVPAYLDRPTDPAILRSFYHRSKVLAGHHRGHRIHRPQWQENKPVRCSDSSAAAAGY